MRAYEIQGSFGLENLRPVERPDPKPGAGQIVLRMKGASLNYRDLMMVRGHYNPRQPLPLIPCSDGVGEVAAVGDGVSRVSVGDRVATIFSQTWIAGPPDAERLRATVGGPVDGTLCERMVVDAEAVFVASGRSGLAIDRRGSGWRPGAEQVGFVGGRRWRWRRSTDRGSLRRRRSLPARYAPPRSWPPRPWCRRSAARAGACD